MTESIYCEICGNGNKYLIWNNFRKYYLCRKCFKLVGWITKDSGVYNG